MNKTKFVNLLSMAQRAGALISGDFMVEKTIRHKGAHLLLIATDIAANNSKKYSYLSEEYRIEAHQVLSKEEMGQVIGKERRVVIAVIDQGFAQGLLKIIKETP